MNNEQNRDANEQVAEAAPGGRGQDLKQARPAWCKPRVLWTEAIQTLAYTCAEGPAPVSGTTCPP